MKCKNCGEKEAIKYSKYSNGEFCSRECARSYPTKEDKKETKEVYCISCGEKMEVGKRTDPRKVKCENCKPKPKKRRRGKREKRICKNCGSEFDCLSIKIRNGGGFFCTISCYLDFQKKNGYDEETKKYHNILYQKKCKYGLNEEEYLKMMENEHCMICEKEMKSKCIDHDHKTGEIRGVICHSCNRGLGFFHDSVNNLKKAIEYIEKNKK